MFYVCTSDGMSVSFPGKETFTVAKDHPNFDQILKMVQKEKNPSYQEVADLVDIKKAAAAGLEFEGVTARLTEHEELVLSIDGKEVRVLSTPLCKRLVAMLKERDSALRTASYRSFARFIKNMYQNPSYKSVEQLYGFLDANDLPITQNGTFLAYKKVRHDYLDIHSHTMSNAVGQVVEMPRNEVEDDPSKTCSVGLHVCSYDYLEHYSESELDRIVICEVNPADVVSVPTDYHNAKMRTCKYTVIDEVPTHFEARLGSYVYGKHAEGWINKTWNEICDFYKKFFKTKVVEFSSLPDTIDVTPAVVKSYFTKVEKAFGTLPDSFKENYHSYVPTMKDLFQVLSKYDDNWQYNDNADKDEPKAKDKSDAKK